jgi:hypothetical protein
VLHSVAEFWEQNRLQRLYIYQIAGTFKISVTGLPEVGLALCLLQEEISLAAMNLATTSPAGCFMASITNRY